MSDEQTGAAIVAALTGGQAEPTPPDGFDNVKRSIAERHGLAPDLGERLRGSTPDELETDAAAMASLVRQEPAEPEHVRLARAAIAAAEDAGRDRLQEAGLLNPAKAERDRAFIEALHPTKPEES